MSHVFRLRLAILLLAATGVSGVGTSCSKLTGLHNGCVTTADCNPGRHCVMETCQPGTDQDASVVGDGDTGSGGSAGSGGAAGSAGSADALDLALEKAGNDHPDARLVDDASDANGTHDSDDAHDASGGDDGLDAPVTSDASNGGDAVDARPDALGDQKRAPSPCFLASDAAVAPTSATVPEDLSGTWLLCTDATSLAPDIRWMLGDTGTIQLDGVNWWRLANGQADHGAAAFTGTYFRLLEGTRSVFEFIDGDVNAAGGATLAVGLFPGATVLELTSCDGAGICDGPTARLMNMAGASGR